jgi:hypothetical protein
MSVGASLILLFGDFATTSSYPVDRSHHKAYWRPLLGGVLGALLLSAAAYGNPVHIASEVVEPASEAMNLVRPIADGLYFYGSAAQPDEIGHAYMVFAAQNSEIMGAIFMPQSSFDCFRGQISGDELALQITNSYTQETYDYPIALATVSDPVASVGTAEVPLQLEGFYDLGEPREADTEILAVCQGHLAPAETEL